MLPPFIIEQIRKREQDDVRPQPVLELPLPEPLGPPAQPASDEQDRGVVVIDLMG